MIEKLRKLGYRVGWAQGATPEEVREEHRRNGWAWEGDTHVEHHVFVSHVGKGKNARPVEDPQPIQHHDPDGAGYVPEHRVLRDDSHEPTIWFVEGPVKGNDEFGAPTGYRQRPREDEDEGLPIDPLVRGYVRDDDYETIGSLIDSHEDRLAVLAQLETETPEETAERAQREAEERAAAEE